MYENLIPSSVRLDDSTEAGFLAKATFAAAERKPLYLDRLVELTSPDLPLPAGLVAFGLGPGGFTGAGWCSPTDRNVALGLTHARQPNGWRMNMRAGTQNFYSEGERFIDCTVAIRDSGASGSSMHASNTFKDFDILDCDYGVMALRLANSTFESGYIHYSAPTSTPYAVQINGGYNLMLRSIRVGGGRAGINCMPLGNTEAPHHINIIEPELSNISEEFISADSRANDQQNSAFLDFFRLDGSDNGGAVTNGTHLFINWTADTIQDPTKFVSAGAYANRGITVLTGANRGKWYAIGGAPGWGKFNKTAKLAVSMPLEDAALFAAGDEIAITATPTFINIVRPQIYMGTPKAAISNAGGSNQCAISFWGAGYGCRLIEPEIWGGTVQNRVGIRVAHVSGIAPRASAYRNKLHRGQLPASGVEIYSPVCHDCDIEYANFSYGTNLEVDYVSYLKNPTFTGDGKLRVLNWRNNQGVTGSSPTYALSI